MSEQIKERPPIYVESLMTYAEWRARMKKYPNTSHVGTPRNAYEFPPGHMKWRQGMGQGFTMGDIHIINMRIDHIKEKGLLLPKHDSVRSEDGHYPGIPFHP